MQALVENLVRRSCPVCRNEDESRIFAPQSIDLKKLDEFAFASRKLPENMHYRLVECPSCDLLYVNPAPRLDAIAKAYVEASYDSSEEAQLACITYDRILSQVVGQLPDLIGALDIGTGNGTFLKSFVGKGFTNIEGVEPSFAPIVAADPDIAPLIKQRLFAACDYQKDSFSLISCFQTIEHLYNPMTVVEDSHSLLKPGGALILVGHNRRALSAKILGMKSPIFDIEHMQLFSPKSMKRMLEQVGFKQIRVFGVVNHYPIHYMAKLFPLPVQFKKKLLPILKDSAIGKIKLSLPLGNIAAIGYRA
jgi:2-polyprenyl-3-methyl-5-hydroxy-6-metoxy-1,4-benzoquinol methylase